jgi:hypothetical protein
VRYLSPLREKAAEIITLMSGAKPAVFVVMETSIAFLQAWCYVLAELVGGALAGASAWPLYGTGPDFGVWHAREEVIIRHP